MISHDEPTAPQPRQLVMRRPDLDGLPPLELPAGCEIRDVRGGEEPALADLLTASFGEPWNVERVRDSFIDAPDVTNTYVAVRDGRLIATASARLVPNRFPGSGYVHWVGVHPDARGMRLGFAVSLRTMIRFRELGCRSAVLETDDWRVPAIKTYFTLGFRPENACPTHPDRWNRILETLGPWLDEAHIAPEGK
jgi:ribosomal protein S18 acetylase RimI-like enzyme